MFIKLTGDEMLNNKNILAIVPARGGSKGVKKKNIKLLNGIPLIGHTLLESKKSKYIDRLIVSTDDMEIAEISEKYGGEIPCLRPYDLALDTSLTVDVVMHMLQFLHEKENYKSDYICLLQCTSPFRTYEDIDKSFEKLISSEFDGIISVCEAEVNPYWTNVFEGSKLKYFLQDGKGYTRRQDLPKIYRCNGAIYIIKTDVFIKNKSFETDNITGYIMTSENSIDIDTELDFKIAEILKNGSRDI